MSSGLGRGICSPSGSHLRKYRPSSSKLQVSKWRREGSQQYASPAGAALVQRIDRVKYHEKFRAQIGQLWSDHATSFAQAGNDDRTRKDRWTRISFFTFLADDFNIPLPTIVSRYELEITGISTQRWTG